MASRSEPSRPCLRRAHLPFQSSGGRPGLSGNGLSYRARRRLSLLALLVGLPLYVVAAVRSSRRSTGRGRSPSCLIYVGSASSGRCRSAWCSGASGATGTRRRRGRAADAPGVDARRPGVMRMTSLAAVRGVDAGTGPGGGRRGDRRGDHRVQASSAPTTASSSRRSTIPRSRASACYVSRARTGGISGSLGLAEDTSDASIACRQVGPVRFRGELEEGEEVFGRRASVSSSASRWCASTTRRATRWSTSPTPTG